MTTRTVTESMDKDVARLVRLMTVASWVLLGIGVLLSLFSLNQFNDFNTPLMVGIGFMVGSVFVYVIRTAIHLVHSQKTSQSE